MTRSCTLNIAHLSYSCRHIAQHILDIITSTEFLSLISTLLWMFETNKVLMNFKLGNQTRSELTSKSHSCKADQFWIIIGTSSEHKFNVTYVQEVAPKFGGKDVYSYPGIFFQPMHFCHLLTNQTSFYKLLLIATVVKLIPYKLWNICILS